MEAIKAQAAAEAEAAAVSLADRTAMTDFTDAETTYAANTTTNFSAHSSNKSGLPTKKKVMKPKMSAKEKKERSVRFPKPLARSSAY